MQTQTNAAWVDEVLAQLAEAAANDNARPMEASYDLAMRHAMAEGQQELNAAYDRAADLAYLAQHNGDER